MANQRLRDDVTRAKEALRKAKKASDDIPSTDKRSVAARQAVKDRTTDLASAQSAYDNAEAEIEAANRGQARSWF